MGKANKKTGAARKDTWYMKAKEMGYRARSAFKLVHLNRKYDLLSSSKVVIDLCAAPGGWLQVAEKYMPKGSLIVGVDLDPIRPIPHVISFVSDITTQQCRNVLRSHLKHLQADLVMHDGAPNVGTAWVQDAFTQSELVLQSLKLAVEFLRKGGNFVTKVFRSGDYNSLMWVFGQLFGKVEATKPPSSRNVSAEIFVVCQDFLAPKYIDPKFLDPKHVFKELTNGTSALPKSITMDPTSSTTDSAGTVLPGNGITNPGGSLALNVQNIFAPEKKRRHRSGYAEGDYTLFRAASVAELVHASALDAVTVLSTANKFEWDMTNQEQKMWRDSRHTTAEVLGNMSDLKVLGKGDFKRLMKWRLAIRLEVGLDVKKKEVEDDLTEKVTIVDEVDEEEQLTEEMQRVHTEALAKARRDRRKNNEKKNRTIQRLHLQMTAPEDMGVDDDKALQGEDVFDLGEGEREMKRKGVPRNKAVALDDLVRDADGLSESEPEEESDASDEEILDSEEEREHKTSRLEGALDSLYDTYRERMNERDAKWKVKQARLRDRTQDAWHGIREGSDAEDDGVVKVQGYGAGEPEGSDVESEGGWDLVAANKAKIGEELDSSDDSASEISDAEEGQPKRKRVRLALPGAVASSSTKSKKVLTPLVTNIGADVERAEISMAAQVWFDQSMFKDVGDLAALDGDDESSEDGGDDEDAGEESGDEMERAAGEQDIRMDHSHDDEDEDEDDYAVVPAEPEDDGTAWDVENEDQDEVKQKKIKSKGLLTAEAVTMATALVNRQITAGQMLDDGFNKHNFNHKDGLPDWFLDDEGKHYKTNLPVTKEAMQVLRAKQRALDARPIKKVAEAKARKKFKAHQKMEKAKKKADGLLEAPDMSERDKANTMQKILGRATGKPKRKETKLVVARGANKGVKGRPKGVTGRYKIVDARLRKEMRALKRIKKSKAPKRNKK